MNKIEFVQRAPTYYAIAIFAAIERATGVKTRESIDSFWDKENYILSNDSVWNAAVRLMGEAGVIEIIEDDFGPDLYRATPALQDWFNGKFEQENSAVTKYKAAGKAWLKDAISQVNRAYAQLRIQPDDFKAVEESEWQPIPIDRQGAEIKRVEEALEEAIEKIEGDNAYPVHAPDERKYVLTNLKAFKRFLSENTSIYISQVDAFVIQPVKLVIARYGSAATGLAGTAVRQAVFDWIKTHAAKLLSLIG